ncbi:DUF937 domain-containing protein [Streptomyces sp. CBMA152]|uniref:DUF937 domain-containing protein n=1 Tax=Streptomyces sp. CBMA152 TaxID=1896312 RepID=UPI001660E8B7|nr:DUF937 domain-containing protein [Streptomyces sp. CBMA152]MBD0747411.1 hypothetical protein [Streptomyces sp. CBMA152]
MSDDSTFEQDVLNELGDDGLEQLAQELGTDPAGARAVVGTATSELAGELPGLSPAPDEPPLQGVATLGGLGMAGGGVMATVLAKVAKPVARTVSKKTGLPEPTVTRALELLIPVALTVLSKRAAAKRTK